MFHNTTRTEEALFYIQYVSLWYFYFLRLKTTSDTWSHFKVKDFLVLRSHVFTLLGSERVDSLFLETEQSNHSLRFYLEH